MKIHDDKVSNTMSAYSATYCPGLRMMEPRENVKVVEITHTMTKDGAMIHHAVYRRDSNFSGTLSDALKVFQWGK